MGDDLHMKNKGKLFSYEESIMEFQDSSFHCSKVTIGWIWVLITSVSGLCILFTNKT